MKAEGRRTETESDTMATLHNTTARRWLVVFSFCLLPSAFCLSGCHRAPDTAAELQRQLPRQFRGEMRWAGDAQPHPLVIEPHELSVRGPHLLEFNKVRYQVLGGGEALASGDASIRGTISTTELEIRVEEASDSGDAIKADTFKGHLSADLQTAECEWTNGLGQPMKLKITAAAP